MKNLPSVFLNRAGIAALAFAASAPFCVRAATATAETEPFRLSVRHDGVRASAGDEELRRSNLWSGGAAATVTLAQDGVPLAEGLAGEGAFGWHVARNGTYMLTHTTYTNGVAGAVETAVFVVTGRDVPFADGDVSVAGWSGRYDGVAHGVSVTLADGITDATVQYARVPDKGGANESSPVDGGGGSGTAVDDVPSPPVDLAWTATPPAFTDAGAYTVWCAIVAPGYLPVTNSATVSISPRTVTLTSGSASKTYDGLPVTCADIHVGGDGFADGEGATYNVTSSQTVVGESTNTFTYALNENTKPSNYTIATTFGTLTVTKATLGGGDGGSEEPGDGAVAEDGLSKFDVSTTYDGFGHTLDTNALVAAFRTAIVGDFTVEYAVGTTVGRDVPVAPQDGATAGGGAGRAALPEDGTGAMAESVDGTEAASATPPEGLLWSAVVPAFTNAGEYVVWYRVTSPNYTDFAHAAKVAIAKRMATIASGDGAWTYDGAAHSNVTVSAAGFVDGEGVAARDFATITDAGTKPNAFEYDFLDGTLAANYSVTCATGTLAVTKATLGGGDGGGTGGEEPGDGAIAEDGLSKFDVAVTYDGLGHTVDTNALVSAFRTASVGGFTVEYAVGATVGRDVPVAPQDGATVGGGAGRTALPDDGTGAMAESVDGTDAAPDATTPPEDLAWSSAAPAFTNAGEYVVWYRVSSPNYEAFTHAAKVVIAKRPATLTSGDGTWTYDGAAHSNAVITAEGFVDGEGVVAHGFATIVDAGEKPNSFAYDFLDGTLAANYSVTCATGTLAVAKATLGGSDGDEPGAGTVPAGGLSKFDATFVYDGRSHTIDTNALLSVEKAGCTPTVSYSLTREGIYQDEAFAFTDVVATSFWYRISLNNANYADYVHEARLTITPRDIALVTVASIADQEFAGAAVEPTPVVADGEPSIVTDSDYAVSYSDNATPGTATLTLTGCGNYTGTKTVFFVIRSAAREVVFDALGGRIDGVSVTVTQTLARAYGELPAATRAGYAFDGWFLGVTNGAPAAARGEPLLVDGAHTLYARWSPAPSASSAPETLYAWEATGASTARILGFRDPSVRLAQLNLPDRIGGQFVTAVADGAFANTTCGATSLALPVFCTSVGDRAFYNAASLASIVFADARRWDDPAAPATVSVGRYAFSSCLGLTEVTLDESVSSLGDYAFLNCRNLRRIVVLGRPSVGQQVFRSAGVDGADGVAVLIDPSFADDADYMAQLKAGIPTVTVRSDAVVAALRTASLAVSGRTVRLSVDVVRASAWGEVDTSALRVECRARLGDAPVVRTPRAVVRGADGSLTLEVDAPEGASGFFRVRLVD